MTTKNTEYSSSVMEFYGLDHVKFRSEKIADDVEFPREYFIVEPVMILQEELCCGLLDVKATPVQNSIGQHRRKFILHRVDSYCGWRTGFYHEVVD